MRNLDILLLHFKSTDAVKNGFRRRQATYNVTTGHFVLLLIPQKHYIRMCPFITPWLFINTESAKWQTGWCTAVVRASCFVIQTL